MKKNVVASAIFAILSAAALVPAQSVIINEWSQGNGGTKEWIEALVVAGPVDMRGWGFTDSTTAIDSCAQLSTDSNWAAVPTGTLIVVYNGSDVDTTIVPDTNFADGNFKIVVASNEGTLTVGGRSFPAFSNSTATDNARLLDSAGMVMFDWDQGDQAGFTAGSLRPVANQTVQYSGNTAPGAAIDTNWSRISSTVATPGSPNGSATANETWILSLRGATANDPNIDGPIVPLNFGRLNPSATKNVNYTVTNTGASVVLNVSGSTITGTDASAFSLVSEPTGIAANGGSGIIQLQFNPGASEGSYSATLTVNSNDSGSDSLVVPLTGVVADVTPFNSLYITEAVSQPTEDEFVEIQNLSATTMNIGGVVVSDEDNSNTEGAVKFPAGTMLAPGEVVVVAVNNSLTAPSWLASVPSGTRVFYEPVRDGLTTWVAPSGVTLVAMEDFETANGGTGSVIALSGEDGVAIYHPNTTFNAGPNAPGMALDGVNYDNSVIDPICPINSNGDFDTDATRIGADQPAIGDSIKRLDDIANINSSITFEISTGLTPGVALTPSNLLSAGSWNLYN